MQRENQMEMFTIRRTEPDLPGVAVAPNWRETDPRSSREAAERHEWSGRAGSSRMRALAAVCAHPEGLTSRQVAEVSGLERHEAARRLPDLEKMGLIYGCEERRYGRCFKYWYAVKGKDNG